MFYVAPRQFVWLPPQFMRRVPDLMSFLSSREDNEMKNRKYFVQLCNYAVRGGVVLNGVAPDVRPEEEGSCVFAYDGLALYC